MEESAALREFKRDDGGALDALYRQHRQAVYRYACTLTGRRADADDLLQDAFLGLVRNLDHVRAASQVLPYLLRSVRNRHVDRLRRKHSRHESLEGVESESTIAAPWRRSEETERLEQLTAALATLPIEQAETVRLRVFGELSYEQIAGELGVPAATARTRYRLALEKLKQSLGRTVGDV